MTCRAPILLILLLVVGCSRSPTVQANPPQDETSTAGLETAAVRETLVSFLEAYARSGRTLEPLRDLVTGPKLRDWVHWLGVQNRYLVQSEGRLEVRALRVLQVRDEVAAAALDATVTFTFMTGDRQRERVTARTFQSPAILSRGEAIGSWTVVDLVRDGRSMTDSITLLDPPVTARGSGLEVEVVSVYRFSSGTVVNVRVQNTAPRPVRIDRERSVIVVDGQPLRPLGTTPTLVVPLPTRRQVEAAFDFPNVPPMAVPEAMLVRLHGEEQPVVLAFPRQAFAQGA